MKMPAGLAQGTALNILLYTIYVSDIPIPRYVDDVAVYTSGHHPNDIVSSLNIALANIREYFIKWKIRINAYKLQAIILPVRRKQEKPTVSILYGNTRVHLEKSIKYLGITLDEMLTFDFFFCDKLVVIALSIV